MKMGLVFLMFTMPIFASATCKPAEILEGKWQASFLARVLSLGDNVGIEASKNSDQTYNLTITAGGSELIIVGVDFNKSSRVPQYLSVRAEGKLGVLPVNSSCTDEAVAVGIQLPGGQGIAYSIGLAEKKGYLSIMQIIDGKIVKEDGLGIVKK